VHDGGQVATARSLRLVAVLVGLLAAAIVGAAPAFAEPPQRLDRQITDTAGALVGSESEVAGALADLQASSAIQLWVAYVPTFDGLSGQDWTDQTATLSGLGGNDVLFAVAVDDRAYGYSVDDTFPLSNDELARIMATQVEPRLIDSDWPGAVLALADGLATAIAGGATGGATGPPAQDSGGGPGALVWVLGGAVLLGGALLAVVLVRRVARSAASGAGSGPGAPPGAEPIESVRQRAAAALIDADDSIRTSEQELGFAIAQFGDEAAAPFTAALAESKAELQRAFALQQQAQDVSRGGPVGPGAAAPTTPATERDLLTQVLDLCTSADARLDAQVEAFDQMRDLERTIDTVLPDLAGRVESLGTRLDSSRSTADGLGQAYPMAALAPLTTNLEQAEERIRFARDSVEQGASMLHDGDRGGAVARARAAEEALGQAGRLLDDVDAAPDALAQAQRAVGALVAETAKDIAEAESLGLSGPLESAHHFAADTLAWARAAMEAGNYDPIVVRRALDESDGALERALAPAREAAATRARAQALLPTTREAAEISVRVADDFITTRRGAVGAEARTRLAEAQRRLAAGVALSDPVAALAELQAADHLADQAHVLAQQDEARYRDNQYRRGGGGGTLGTMVLGGILIDALARGGAGGPRGIPMGGGFRPSGGTRGPGSFGGGGTRGRRGGGGRF
jgi:uncharacterized membrane protein YgcG